MMKEFPAKPDRLAELIESLQNEGHLPEAKFAELEALLAGDEAAREYYVLSQELHTMLEADKSIRLQLASDLLPENVIPLPGVDLSQVAIPRESPRRKYPVEKASRTGFRFATSFAAVIAAVFALLWMHSKVSEIAIIAAENQENAMLANRSGKVSFHDEVLPILTDHCFECHGEGEDARKGDLRLDVAHSAFRGKKPAIVPGKPERSELVARISSSDPEYRMPPPEAKRRLTSGEIETLKKWIAQGADYESDWSFRGEKIDWIVALLGQ